MVGLVRYAPKGHPAAPGALNEAPSPWFVPGARPRQVFVFIFLVLGVQKPSVCHGGSLQAGFDVQLFGFGGQAALGLSWGHVPGGF